MADMSFLPADYLEKRAQRRTNLISLTLFVIVMSAIVAAFFWTDQQDTDVRKLRQTVDKQFEEAAKRLEQMDELHAHKQQMMTKASVTASLIEKVRRTVVLSELINHMPTEMGLLELALESKELRSAPAASPRTAMDKARANKAASGQPLPEIVEPVKSTVKVTMVGIAPTDVQVAQFMTKIGKNPLFTDLNLQYSEESKIDDRAMRKFRVEMMLNQEVDMQQFEPTMVKRELKQNPMDEDVVIGDGTIKGLPPAPGNAPDTRRTGN
jgi:Tfp pilus assembly protein PilN